MKSLFRVQEGAEKILAVTFAECQITVFGHAPLADFAS